MGNRQWTDKDGYDLAKEIKRMHLFDSFVAIFTHPELKKDPGNYG